MSRTLIIIGLAIAAVGFLWPWIARLGLGRLPGDISSSATVSPSTPRSRPAFW